MARFDYILHRADGVTTVELNSQVGTFRAVTSERLTAVRQDVSSAELTLISSEAFTVNVGDWIQAKGMRLYCMSTIDRYTCSEDNNREYQITFYSPEYYLRLAIFYNTSESESGGAYSYSRVDNTYPSVGTFEDFAKLCCYNCNSVQGERIFKVGTVSEDIATDIRVITFSDYNCLAVLKQSCEEFETTWRVRVNEDVDPDSVFIIDFGVEIEDFPVTLEVEKSKGLLSIEVTASDKDVFTQFVIKGGGENLPSDYPYPNLQLDEDPSSTPPILANSMIKLPDLYARWGKSVKELVNENIKPSRTGTVTAISENILKFTDNDLIGVEWSPVGGTVHFVSGHLIGFTFNCKEFDSATGEITIESTEENNGFTLPSPSDSYYRINEEDKYNIAGVSLPTSYVTAAKEELKEWSIAKINDYWSQPRMQAAINIDPSIISVDIVPNMGLPIIHEALAINKIIKVQQVVYDLSKESPYDIESILISDLKTDDSRADATHRQIATTAHRLDDADKVSTSIKTSVRNLDTYIDGAFADGLVSEAEAKAIEKYINIVNSQKSDIDAQFTALYANSYLSGDPKTNLNSAKEALNTATTNLLSSINTAIADGSATAAEKADVDSKFTAFNSAISTYQTRVEEAQEAISAAMKILAENAAKSYAEARDILLKEKTDAYADDVATAAEEAAIEAAQLKVDAAKLVWEAYADGVVSDEEADRIADAQAKYEAALNYADSLASDSSDETDTKVAAAKNALATKFGYTDWSAMEAAASLIGGMTTSAGLINANVIDVTTLAALDAFIEELVVIKLETAVDEDGTKVRIDADAVDGRAGVLLEENTGDKGIKLYYKYSSGVPVFVMYSVSTGELLEFLANRMKFSKGSTKDITIDSDSTILQLRSSTNYAQITPSTLRVDGLATAPVGAGHFWVDTSTGIVHWGIVTPPTVTYSFDIDVTYPSGRSDIAASGGTATFTVKLITTTDGVSDAGVLVDLDTGYPSVTSSPTGTNFSITRTGTGTYSITAASRGTVEDSGTAAAISVKYTPSGATQQSTSFNILQEANGKTKTDEDTGITLSISTIYDDSDCAASGDTWTVTASGESGGREEYTYTSGASEWVSLGGTPITASLIEISTDGTGLSGSGYGNGASVTWADRETTTGDRRSGTVTASYSGESVQETVYQQYNKVESVTDKTINWVKLDGTNGNIEVDADSGYTLVTVELGYTNNYTSGDTYSGTTEFGQNLSVSGTGFTKFSNGRVDYTENTASSTRNGVITITYGDATPVQRTITQAAASATTYQILGEVTYSSGSQIPASGGTATLTVTKQTYINGVHQSASDVLIDCDSGYPDLVSQPTGCDVSITRTTTGTYSVSAESRGTTVNSGTEIEIDLASTVEGSLKTDSVTVIQQANALVSSTGYAITSVTLDGVNDDIGITKSAQTITVLGSGTYTKTYTSGASESANFNLGASDISVSGTGFSYSNFTISVAANSGAERECTVTASYSGATNVTRTITQAMGIVAPSLNLDLHSLSGNTLTLKASVSSAGGGTITACGFERGNTSSLGIDVSASTVQSGQFTADVSVIPGQTIYWRAYATNEAGTTYTAIYNTTV